MLLLMLSENLTSTFQKGPPIFHESQPLQRCLRSTARCLSPGHDHDAPHGRALLQELRPMPGGLPLLMGRAYEGNETRQLVLDLGMIPVVPPKSNRLHPWEYDRAPYKKRNEIERLFRRLKGFRRIFSRFEKLDVVFLAFLCFALIVEALRIV